MSDSRFDKKRTGLYHINFPLKVFKLFKIFLTEVTLVLSPYRMPATFASHRVLSTAEGELLAI